MNIVQADLTIRYSVFNKRSPEASGRLLSNQPGVPENKCAKSLTFRTLKNEPTTFKCFTEQQTKIMQLVGLFASK
jgi:hypothetical protein